MNGDREDLRLEGEGIRLRTFMATDVSDDFVSWLNDPKVVQYSNQRFLTHTRESCLSYLQSFGGTDNLYLAIEDMVSGRLYGSITAYRQLHHGTADIGILVGDSRSWGRGVGYKAWSLLMYYLIERCDVRKVTGGALSSNEAMVRIMEKSGMKLEASRSAQEVVDGVACDVLHFCKFAEES